MLAFPYLDIQVYRELARTTQTACFTPMFGCEVEGSNKEPASSPGSEACDSRPGLLTLTERKSGGCCSPLLPCSGVLCLRAAWLGPFSELGNLRTVSDRSSLRPSSSDELFSRGFGGSGGGTPGLMVELRRQTLNVLFQLMSLEGVKRFGSHSQLHVFKGVFEVSDMAPVEDTQHSQNSTSAPTLRRGQSQNVK